jgi:L-threonylcarbamoyladenylate synthase
MFVTEIGTNITTAAQWLKNNQVVAIPTETVYGLAANALNDAAVVKIFETKQRPTFNPLIVHVPTKTDIAQFADINQLAQLCIDIFFPGPLTLLLPKKNSISNLVTAGSSKVAIRMPQHPLLLQLLQQLPFPLVAPSANMFGYVSPTNAQHVYNGLQNKIPYILNGGPSQVGIESTIIEPLPNNTAIIHRVGGLPLETIQQKLSNVTFINAEITTNVQTAGQLKSHYATNTPLLVCHNLQQNLTEHKAKKIACLLFKNTATNMAAQQSFIVAPDGLLTTAAANLFATMQKIDVMGFDIILAEVFPNEGLGVAINDRLQRAQYLHKP